MQVLHQVVAGMAIRRRSAGLGMECFERVRRILPDHVQQSLDRPVVLRRPCRHALVFVAALQEDAFPMKSQV